MSRKHPLASEPNWRFRQHQVGLQAPLRVVSAKSKRGAKKVISVSNVCREGAVHDVRRNLQVLLTSRKKISGWAPMPSGRVKITGSADLNDESLKQPGESFLSVASAHITGFLARKHPKAGKRMPRGRDQYMYGINARYPQYTFYQGNLTDPKVQDFIDLCNAVIGPITILLNPDRFEGNWWDTTVGEAKSSARSGFLRWYGIDNSVLAHPALVSLYTGLARQCALMARCDVKGQVMGCIDEGELEECLTNSDPELALKLAKALKQWIEVPVPTNGTASNVPVPSGSFNKIPILHKALYTHGFEETFGKSFEKGWAILGDPYGFSRGPAGHQRYSGIHSYMGRKANNQEGQRIRGLAGKVA